MEKQTCTWRVGKWHKIRPSAFFQQNMPI